MLPEIGAGLSIRLAGLLSTTKYLDKIFYLLLGSIAQNRYEGVSTHLTLNQICVPITVPREVDSQFTRGRQWHRRDSSPAP